MGLDIWVASQSLMIRALPSDPAAHLPPDHISLG
jgi:hypothetical protein